MDQPVGTHTGVVSCDCPARHPPSCAPFAPGPLRPFHAVGLARSRVRYPTDWSFTSCCSPPRLATTQLQSVTSYVDLERTFTSPTEVRSQAHQGTASAVPREAPSSTGLAPEAEYQRLKPPIFANAPARLKPCPDTPRLYYIKFRTLTWGKNPGNAPVLARRPSAAPRACWRTALSRCGRGWPAAGAFTSRAGRVRGPTSCSKLNKLAPPTAPCLES